MFLKKLCRLLALCVILFNLFLLYPKPILACSCIIDSPEKMFVEADAIFIGTVTAIIAPSRVPNYDNLVEIYYNFVPPLPNVHFDEFDSQRVMFKVETSWKGIDKPYTIIRTGEGHGNCGYNFIQGNQYVVYGYGRNGNLATGICSRTAEISRATEDLDYLQTLPKIELVSKMPFWLILCSILLMILVISLSTIWGIRWINRVVVKNP